MILIIPEQNSSNFVTALQKFVIKTQKLIFLPKPLHFLLPKIHLLETTELFLYKKKYYVAAM